MESFKINGHDIHVDDQKFVNLTDLAKVKDAAKASSIVSDWLCKKATFDFVLAWETGNNKNFNHGEFAMIKQERAEQKDYRISAGELLDRLNVKCLYTKIGKCGGTYAHEDLVMEFCTSISAEFRLQVFREYRRLKELERNLDNIDWHTRRIQGRDTYAIQTNAIKLFKIPLSFIPPEKESWAYAEEGDILNLALFGFTAAQWRKHNISLASKRETPRFYASINELTMLIALESVNAVMITENRLSYAERLEVLRKMVAEQLPVLNKAYPNKSLKKATDGSFQALYKQENHPDGMFPQMPFMEYVEQKRLKPAHPKQ